MGRWDSCIWDNWALREGLPWMDRITGTLGVTYLPETSSLLFHRPLFSLAPSRAVARVRSLSAFEVLPRMNLGMRRTSVLGLP